MSPKEATVADFVVYPVSRGNVGTFIFGISIDLDWKNDIGEKNWII